MAGMDPRLKKSLALAAVLLAAAAAAVLFLILRREPARDFQRLAVASPPAPDGVFQADPASGTLHVVEQGQPRELKGIPGAEGCRFLLSGRREFVLPSPYAGKTGFYSHVLLEAAPGGAIEFALGVRRRGRTETRQRLRQERFSGALLQELELARGDELVIACQGEGVVYFSPPILYRIKKTQEQKYVFLVGVDTLRADAIGSRVNGLPLTPNIDRFKADAVDFARCYSQSNWTLPAFMSFFTGQYEFHHQMTKSSTLEADKPFLVRGLAEGHVTLNLNGGTYMSKNFGYARHFDYFESAEELFGSTGGRALFAKALDFVDRGRFPAAFLFLHTYQVHAPYAPPAEFLERLNPRPAQRALDSVTFNQRRKKFARIDDALTASYKELYRAEILAFDSYFGGFLAALKERGLYENSLIVLMSDHGEEFFEHGGWAHNHSLYAELVHVPLVIKFPGNRHAGRTVRENVGVIDILPTVLAAVGRPLGDEAVDGVDLSPLLAGGKLARPFLYSSIANGRFLHQIPAKFAIFTDRFKVIYNYEYSPADLRFFAQDGLPPETGQIEIYDLESDPGDRTDLFAARKDVFQQASREIRALRVKIDASLARRRSGRQRQFDQELQKQMKSLGYL